MPESSKLAKSARNGSVSRWMMFETVSIEASMPAICSERIFGAVAVAAFSDELLEVSPDELMEAMPDELLERLTEEDDVGARSLLDIAGSTPGILKDHCQIEGSPLSERTTT